MYKKSLFVLFSLLFTSAILSAQSGALADILVAKVSGRVVATGPSGDDIVLTRGTKLTEQYTVTSGADGNAVLLFSNGSSLVVKPDTSFSIEEYQSDPHSFNKLSDLANLDNEPSKSITKLKLNRGELVGNVKKLNYSAGSQYEIESPVGTAGIRGTDWSLTIVVDVTGNVEGKFGISTGAGVWIDLSNQPVTVGNQAVVVIKGRTNADGSVTIEATEARDMTVEESATIESQVEEVKILAEQLAKAEVTPPPPPPLVIEEFIESDDPTPTTGEGSTLQQIQEGDTTRGDNANGDGNGSDDIFFDAE